MSLALYTYAFKMWKVHCVCVYST